MAEVYNCNRMKKKSLFIRYFGLLILFLVLLISPVVLADSHEITLADQTFENSADAWTYFENDPSTFSDPAVTDWAFSDNPTRMWTNIESNPNLLSNTNTLNSAFENNPAKAIGTINSNPTLLDKSNVLSRFDQEIQPQEGDTPERIQERSSQLNDNPAAKLAWLSKQYGVKMKDSSVQIISYDGYNY